MNRKEDHLLSGADHATCRVILAVLVAECEEMVSVLSKALLTTPELYRPFLSACLLQTKILLCCCEHRLIALELAAQQAQAPYN